ncbi:MAG: hypothetical protein ABSD63_03585 [Candidatus Korobacteraceae bacterium]
MNVEPFPFVIDGDDTAVFNPEDAGKPFWNGDSQVIAFYLSDAPGTFDKLGPTSLERDE